MKTQGALIREFNRVGCSPVDRDSGGDLTTRFTDHGRPIARIVPIDQPTKLEQLRAEGRVQRAQTRKQPASAPIAADGTVSDLVDAQRR